MPMKLLNFSNVVLQLLLFTISQGPARAALKPYIVCLGSHPHDVEPEFVDVDKVKRSHNEFLESFLQSKTKLETRIHYSYAMHVNAFAAVLDEDEAACLARHSDVVFVSESKTGIKPRTTRSWEFLGLERNGEIPQDSIWKKSRFGEDIIIANLDAGIWPESPSFNDDGMGAVPSKWRGVCEARTRNGTSRCNRKLIGARCFSQGYLANCSLTPGCTPRSYYQSVLDYDGHGTHTLATAGGCFVPGANVLGKANGTAKGGSPRARLAAYKICGGLFPGELCHDSDVLAGFDAAIADGVDVISLSIGLNIENAKDPSEDVLAISAFHAVKRGIVVVAAGGNEGPYPETITNVAPWMITVGASTIDRRFASYIVLGNGKVLEGIGLSASFLLMKTLYPLINGYDAGAENGDAGKAGNCLSEYLDPEKARGKILICRGDESINEVSLIDIGVAGMILVKETTRIGKGVSPHLLPSSAISDKDAKHLYAYLNSTKSPMGYIIATKTEMGIKPSPVVLSMSSRGPNSFIPTILKPDIVGPGENILAAHTQEDDPVELGGTPSRNDVFILQTGSSMACPHIAGIVALLKAMHPNWSPAAIKSAIMTTAETERDMVPILEVNDSEMIPATPFSYGAGHVNPNKAMDPGLVYDLSNNDYLNYLCALGYNKTTMRVFSHKPFKCRETRSVHDFNYPSITVPELGRSLTVTRVLKNVDDCAATYRVAISAPTGISVSVKPSRLSFKRMGQKKTYEVTLKPEDNEEKGKGYVFGKLIWYDGKHGVYTPLVVRLNI